MNDRLQDAAELKRIGIIQQKQRDYYAMRLHAVGGDFTADQLYRVAEVSKRYGRGEVHLSTRQGIEIHFVHKENLEAATKALEDAGIAMGACGPRIRIVVACPGAATCRWGSIDTKSIAQALDAKYFREDTPHKFKISVTGCPHNCAKATENDLGIMGGILPCWEEKDCIHCDLCVNSCPTGAIVKKDSRYELDEERCIHCSICTSNCPTDAWTAGEKGYILWIGGTMGKLPRLGTKLGGLIQDEEELYRMVEAIVAYYRQYGRKRERFGHMIDRLGVEQVKEALLDGG